MGVKLYNDMRLYILRKEIINDLTTITIYSEYRYGVIIIRY